jgi:hypothetical protein
MKDLSTPLIDAAREQRRKFWEQIDALPPLRWYQWRFWRYRFWKWRHGL